MLAPVDNDPGSLALEHRFDMAPFCTVTVDTEEEWDWSAGFPVSGYGTENIQELPRFQDLCARHGLAVTYFTAYGVLRDAAARQTIQELAKRDNVEIGLHIHPWNTPPIGPGPVPVRESFLHNLPEEVALAKLQTVCDKFAEAGIQPVSFRGGRYSTSPRIQEWLADRGFLVDASIVPFTTWPDKGAPDYRARTLQPVRLPSIAPANPSLWEVPLSRGFTRLPFEFWQRCYDSVERSWLRHLRLIGVAEKLGMVRKVWLNFEQHSAEDLLAFLRVLPSLQLPCVNLTLHSSSLRAGCSPYTRAAADVARLYAKLETVFGYLAAQGFQPATMSNVARELELQYASARH